MTEPLFLFKHWFMKRILLLTFMMLATLPSARAQQTKVLHVLQTGDTHSRIEPVPPHSADKNAGLGGVARRAAFVKAYRRQHPHVLLLDCGDISQGSPYYNMFKGEVEIKAMNEMGYDAMTIGNHEFDYGLENMARIFRMARFPVVCANYEVKGTPLEGVVKPYTVVERDGLKIGIFGIGPQPEGLVQRKNYSGVSYLNPVETAQQTATLLKEQEGCDVVICLSHLGVAVDNGVKAVCDEELIGKTRGIDLVLGGHTHTEMETPDPCLNIDGREVPLMHVGRGGAYVGELKLTLARD